MDGIALTHLDVARARTDLEICRAYDIGGQRAERLAPGPPRDLARQEELTLRLLGARPVCDRVTGEWTETVAQALGAPIVLGSYGPTAADKRQLNVRAASGAAA